MRLPPILPNERLSLHDRDDFVRNLLTLLLVPPQGVAFESGADCRVPTPLSPSARDLEPVVPLADLKLYLRIEAEETAEDPLLEGLEMAARLHTENVLRRSIDPDVGENVKQAIKLLAAHWYRNREASGEDKLVSLPLAYEALLSPERDYSATY